MSIETTVAILVMCVLCLFVAGVMAGYAWHYFAVIGG